MALLHKTEAVRGWVCMARGETKDGNISNMLMSETCRCRKGRYNKKGDIYKLSSHVWPIKLKDKVLHRTPCLVSLLALSSPCETFASDNLACSQLSKSYGPGPKMIYTHCFLNINHRAQPSCKTDVRQYDCTVVVPSWGPGYLWTQFIYFLPCFMFSNAVTFSGFSGWLSQSI